MKLYAPEQYWDLSDKARAGIVNGCGPGGGWKGFLVPDTVWGLSISAACNIHDYMYYVGNDLVDKETADRVFLNNILRIIADKTGQGWLKVLRKRRAKTYYLAVKYFGAPAFWAGKNKPEEFQ